MEKLPPVLDEPDAICSVDRSVGYSGGPSIGGACAPPQACHKKEKKKWSFKYVQAPDTQLSIGHFHSLQLADCNWEADLSVFRECSGCKHNDLPLASCAFFFLLVRASRWWAVLFAALPRHYRFPGSLCCGLCNAWWIEGLNWAAWHLCDSGPANNR